MSNSKSCLVAKLSHYADISRTHEQLLSRLEKTERQVKEREEIYAGGDPMKHLFCVKSGWFYGYTNLPDGGRHVVRIYHPGDIIGFSGLAFYHQSINLRSATEGCLCPFEKNDLDQIFETAPTIAALLFTLSSREQVIIIDTLRAASRMRPRARLAFLLLDIASRLRITNSAMTNRFRLPLTQTDIGDTIGLTNVSVSRTLVEMEQDGLIERINGDVVLLREEQLRDICDFHDRHADMDTSWFPGQSK